MSPDKDAVLAAVRARDYRRTTFGRRQRPALGALMETLIGQSIEPARRDSFVADYDHFISRSSKTLRFGMALLLDVLRFLLPPLLLGRFSPFETLAPEDRGRMLEKMESHRIVLISLIFVGFKTPMMIVWFENDALLRELGYPGDARERYKKLLPVAA